MTREPPIARRPLAGLLAAEVISTTGTEMTAVALPWLILVSTGSAAWMGAVLAAEFAGMAVLGLWGGRAATMLGPRRMMLAADLTRAGLIGLIPAIYWAGLLSVAVALAVAFAVGAFFPAYSTSQRLLLAEIASEDELRLTRAGGLLGSVNETASFAGPAIGGALVALIGPARVLTIDAASYVCAFALLAALVPASRPPPGTAEKGGGVIEGLRYVAGHRSLRRQVLGIAFVEVGWTAMGATLRIMALHSGGASLAGGLLACYGAGSVIGGLLSSRARTAGGHTAVWAVSGIAATVGLLLLPVPVWALTVVVAANGVCSGLFFPRFFSALTARTPMAVRARVMTSVTVVISAPAPLGFLGAGLLAQVSGSAVPSLLLAAAAAALGAMITIWGLAASKAPAALPPAPEPAAR